MRHSRCLPATGSPGSIRFAPLLVFVLVTVAAAAAAQGTKTITFADIMRFRAIDRPVISDDGAVIAYGAQPDRGDGEAIVHIVGSGKTISVPRGSGPTISKDGRFVAMTVRPSFAASESADKDKARSGLAIVDVGAGRITTVDAVERFALSDDGRWLAYLLAAETEPATGAKPAAKPAGAGAGQKSDKKPGTTLKLRELASGAELPIPFVTTFGFDPSSRFLAYAVADKQWLANGLFVRALGDRKAQPSVVTRAKDARYRLSGVDEGRRNPGGCRRDRGQCGSRTGNALDVEQRDPPGPPGADGRLDARGVGGAVQERAEVVEGRRPPVSRPAAGEREEARPEGRGEEAC